jgi:hypothetical protein
MTTELFNAQWWPIGSGIRKCPQRGIFNGNREIGVADNQALEIAACGPVSRLHP